MLSLSTVIGCAFAGPAVMEFSLERMAGPNSVLAKRDVVQQDLYNLQSSYKIDFELGTPPQSMEIILDTGSSDFYVLGPDVQACKHQSCQAGLIFDSSKSSSYHQNGTAFRTAYVDGSTANGTWAQDVMQLGSHKITNFNFAIANASSSNQTVGGIGLAVSETPYILNQTSQPYSNLPLQLKESGAISHVSYSLWLNSLAESAGSILFGGIDSTRVASDMYRFPLINSLEGKIDSFAIKLDGLYLVSSDGSQQKFADTSIPVVFDSGTVVSRLPAGILEPFYEAVGAQYYQGFYLVECSTLANGGGVGLVFGGVEYVVSFHDIAVPIDEAGEYCVPGFLTNSVPLIGDNILRSLYVVYDLENLELGVALANTADSLSTASPSYVEISTGIPGTKAPGYSSTSAALRFKTYDVTLGGSNGDGSSSDFFSSGLTSSFESDVESSATASVSSGTGVTFNTGISVTLGSATQTGVVSMYTGVHTVPGASTSGAAKSSSKSSSSQSSSSSSGKKNAAASSHVFALGTPVLSLLGVMVALV